MQDALASTDKNEWVKAMERELESLHRNQVWDLLTKGLSAEQFEKLRLMAGMAPVTEHPETSEKEC